MLSYLLTAHSEQIRTRRTRSLTALLSQSLFAPQCFLTFPCELYSLLSLVPEILDSPDIARTDREVSSAAHGSAHTVPKSPSPSTWLCTRPSQSIRLHLSMGSCSTSVGFPSCLSVLILLFLLLSTLVVFFDLLYSFPTQFHVLIL